MGQHLLAFKESTPARDHSSYLVAVKSLRTHILARCLHIILCVLIIQQGFSASVSYNMLQDSQNESFESCFVEIAEWVCGRDIDIPETRDDNPDPQESGAEEECQESESKEDKNMSHLSSGLNAATATDLQAVEEKLNSILYLHILTPPPEQS